MAPDSRRRWPWVWGWRTERTSPRCSTSSSSSGEWPIRGQCILYWPIRGQYELTNERPLLISCYLVELIFYHLHLFFQGPKGGSGRLWPSVWQHCLLGFSLHSSLVIFIQDFTNTLMKTDFLRLTNIMGGKLKTDTHTYLYRLAPDPECSLLSSARFSPPDPLRANCQESWAIYC